MRHTSQSHRTPIMLGGLILIAGGLISNRDEGHFRQSARAVRNVSLSACAVRNVSAPTAVCSHLDESQGHSITKRRVPNKGTSATRAVAWGSVGRLIDPQISNSTGRRLEVTSDHYSVILRMVLGLFEFLVCQVLGFNNRTNCREGEDSKASPSLAWPGIAIHRLSGYGSTKKFPPSQYSLKHSGTGVVGLFLLWGIQIFKGYQWGQRPAVEMPLIRVSSSPRVEVNEGLLVACAILTGNDVAFGVDCVLPIRGVERHSLGGATGRAPCDNENFRSHSVEAVSGS